MADYFKTKTPVFTLEKQASLRIKVPKIFAKSA